MKTLFRFVLVYLLVSGYYLLMFVVADGNVTDAHLLTLLGVALATALIRFSIGLPLDERAAERRREYSGLLAFTALALYIGLYRHISVPPLAYPYYIITGTVIVLVSMLVGGIRYMLVLVRTERYRTWSTLSAAIIILGFYFQPPLEGGGKLMQYVIDLGTWTFAEPNRAYWASLLYIMTLAVSLACWVEFRIPDELRNVHEHTSATAFTRLNRVFARVIMWVAALTFGLLFVMLREVLDAASPVTWHVLLQCWMPVLVTFVCGAWMVASVEPEGRWINTWVSAFVCGGVLMFANLGPGLSFLERLLITSSVVMCLSTIAGVYSWRNLHQSGAAPDVQQASYRGFITSAGVSSALFVLVWFTCPVAHHTYPVIFVVAFLGMLTMFFRGINEHHEAWQQVAA